MPNSQSFTVTAQGGLLAVLQTVCHLCQGFNPADGGAHPQFLEYQAIWDTGATASVITQAVVDACGLKPIGMVQTHGVHGTELSEVYLVNIRLPQGVAFMHVQVTKGKLVGGANVLIGMDIIAQGDFAVTNKGGITVFSFRVPAQTHIDFVKEFNEEKLREQQQHGQPTGERKKKHKTFGKDKRKKRS